ncbi:MAG TPA: HPF/RaiA family ribosome-associated protein [Holophagaceae bacterium]|nr:HPF/RaiA family ribosome-associated protein [Holophagaceae bacterium]
MAMPVQVVFHDLGHSDAIEAAVRKRAEKLESFFGAIQSCRVVVEIAQKHKHQGKLYNVRIDLTVPQGILAVNRHAHEDVFVAIREAFDAARRRLEDHARVVRGDVKQHPKGFGGRVARVFPMEGYGFIETPGGEEVYFSAENLVDHSFEELTVGTEVHFIEDVAGEGLQAKRISLPRHTART